ncbi:hypothetical protein BH09VER1_BH09VER1_42050 [soil metagenome]
MALKNSKIHVARSGAILGAYDRDKIGDLLDTGHLRPTDHYFDDATGEWVALATLEEPAARPPSGEFKPTDKSEDPSETAEGSEGTSRSPSRSGRRSSSKSKAKDKKGATMALAGWIACLAALIIAMCILAYAMNLSDTLKTANDRISSLEEDKKALQRENQLISEITPAGRVRAVVTYAPTASQVAVMSGATVGLYKRQDVEGALSKLEVDQVANDEQFDQAVTRLKTIIPSPQQITLTDSNGRIDLVTPEAGEYVLVASAAKSTGNGTEKYLWIIGFRANDQPSSLILLNDKNAISANKPDFKITTVNGMASGM